MESATVVQQLLLGTIGETGGGLLTNLTMAVSARVARRFRPAPQQTALFTALEEALTAALATITEAGPLTRHYIDCLSDWLSQEIVLEELSLLLDPGDNFDLNKLRNEFMVITQGYEPEQIPDLNFDAFISELTYNFYQSVKRQTALQEIIKIERLDNLVAQLDEVQTELRGLRMEAVTTAFHAREATDTLRDIRTTIEELKVLAEQVAEVYWRQFQPQQLSRDPAKLQAATARYFKYVLERFRYLDFRGMGMGDRVSLRLPLLDMYVPLKGRIQLPEGETWARELRVAGGQLTEKELETIGQRVSEPIPMLELLRQQPGLIILGDPGAGKTTFLKYLAVQLAVGEGVALGLGWRLPILIPLSAYANSLAQEDISLDNFMSDYYRKQGINLPLKDMLTEALNQGGALFLLDGLDEVQSLAQRALVADRVVAFCTFHQASGNKFILTSRIVGYMDVRLNDPGLVECTLVDFDQPEIEEFVDKWSLALEQAVSGGDSEAARQVAAEEKAALLKAVAQNRGVRQLATNPLLLTILALMKRQGVTLPERRVELYDQYIRTLIRHWTLGRGLDRRGSRELDVVETVRVLGALALWMQQTSPGKGLVKQAAAQRQLTRIYQERGHTDPKRAAREILADARESAGLLVARGQRTYGFIHLTFQEYLAAVGIAQQGQSRLQPVIDLLAEYISSTDWHEVLLLTIGHLGIIQQRDEAASEILLSLVNSAPGEPGEAIVLAGEVAIDTWPGGITSVCYQVVVKKLEAALSDEKVLPRRRALAGAVLGKLGDKRPGVGALPAMGVSPIGTGNLLPDLHFCFVPAGHFWMSEDDKRWYDSDVLEYSFWMGKFPVTNAQYLTFIKAGGYDNANYWWEAQREGVWGNGQVKGWLDAKARQGPYDFGPPFTLRNHPVVGITWYEALAFSRWLDEQLLDLPNSWCIQLPSEAEWEKVARGGLVIPTETIVQPLNQVLEDMEPDYFRNDNVNPRRHYPWETTRVGDNVAPSLANFKTSNIGATSAVGCFPSGTSPYGVAELVGNVWEWTRSLHKALPYDPRDGREQVEQVTIDTPLVLRGGSWWNDEKSARCGARGGANPNARQYSYGFRVILSPFIPGLLNKAKR